MNQATPPHRIEPLENAHIEWEDGAPWSREYQDVYFSRAGGLDETRYVFIDGNDLTRRWRKHDQPGRVFVIGELGFGTGLNFLATWRQWHETGCRHLRLHYISCEKHPLTHEALRQSLEQWPELAEYSEQLLAQYPDHTPGYHRLLLGNEHEGEVTLDLYYGEALTMLAQQNQSRARVDAWFLDGFTPKHNPELWAEDLLTTVAGLSSPGTTASSYSVTGRVVRALRSLGFEVEKRKGFAHKRHMLHARVPEDDTGTDSATRPPPVSSDQPDALVIGAGLAGSTVAWSLARRGYRVTVLESGEEAAGGASGNPQAVLQCRLNRQPDALWQLNLLAFLHASRFYSALQARGHDLEWHPCGVLTLDSAYENTRKAPDEGTYDHYPSQVLRRVSQTEASRICGLPVTDDGMFLPGGGWLNPVRLCNALLYRPGIALRTGVHVTGLDRDGNKGPWHVRTEGNGQQEWSAPVVVLANSHAVRQLAPFTDLPVLPLRGQISQLPGHADSSHLRTVVCGKSYLAPLSGAHRHCLGASYRKGSTDTSLSEEEHREVLAGIVPFLPTLRDTEAARPERASVRGSSADFVPLAGAVPDPGAWRSIYGGAQHLGRRSRPLHAHYLPGLYVSAGHGSHGMAGCPITAEHIASLISAEPSPLPAQCARLIDPWRFMARRARRRAKEESGAQAPS